VTANQFNAAASNNPVFAGQINQFLVDHNVGLYAYDGVLQVQNTTAPTTSYKTNTGGSTGVPQMLAQAFTVGASNFTLGRLELSVAAAVSTGGSSGADTVVTIQTNNSGAPSGTILASCYLPASWLTTTAQILSLPLTCALTASTTYWIVVSSTASASFYDLISSGGVATVAYTSVNGGTTWSAGATELYFCLYDNTGGLLRGIQADAGNQQQSFTYGLCTVDVSMNTDALPQTSFTVNGGTQGFPSAGTFYVKPSGGAAQAIAYTGKTAYKFTGCSGGTGTLSTGDMCYTNLQPTNVYTFTAYQSSVLGNLLVPPDDNFATGVGAWAFSTGSPTVAVGTAALFGLASMMVTTTVGTTSIVQDGAYYPVVALTTYAFQAWVLALTSSLRNVGLLVRWYNSSGAQVTTTSGTVVATSQTVWANPQLLFAAPATSVAARLSVSWGTGTLGDSYSVSGAGIVQAAAVPPWSPGGLGVGQARTLTYNSGTLVSVA